MDPLSAVGVASAAVAFIDFAMTIVHEIHAQCGDGKRLTQRSFDIAIRDLLGWSLTMGEEYVIENDSDIRVKEHFQALQYLLSECHCTAKKLIEALEKLKPKAVHGQEPKPSKWDCFFAALKTHWGAKELEDIKRHIESFRSQLSLRMLAYINAKLDSRHTVQNRHFDALAHQSSQIVDILAVHQQHLDTITGQGRVNEIAVGEALAILKSGEMRPLVVDESIQANKSRARIEFQVGSGVPTYVLSMGDGATSSTGEHEAGNKSFDKIRQIIMGWLYFPQIHYRFESVKPSHQRTLDWVYGETTEQTDEALRSTWSDFATWLRSGSGCYWLRGKAVSGKSTLMKYLYQDERTTTHLRKWSGGRRLVVAGFFFWYLGTPLQKSQAGLIRALLHIIFQQWPPLILEIMPEVCVPYAREGVLSQEEPAIETLWNWFRKLQDIKSQVSVCIFIDGLDEYVGDHSAMAEVFLGMANSCPFLKFVVSSRPINSCVDAFQDSPKLRLENLNQADIRRYTEDKLGPKFNVYGRGDCSEFTEEIVAKSIGVFLWVHLVVLSLLQGLRDGDTTSELATRLHDLPSDLEQLYIHMIDRIPKAYQPQASRIFQLILTRDQVLDRLLGDHREPLSALQFSYAIDDEDADRQLKAGPITNLMQAQRVAFTDARIRSRCFGLVEVVYKDREGTPVVQPKVPSFFDNQNPRFHSVEYMHRTAFEFLTQPHVETKLRSLLGSQAFEPLGLLFRSCVALARASEPEVVLQGDVDDVKIWGRLLEALLYAKVAEEKGLPLAVEELELLDAAYSRHWENCDIFYKRMDDSWVSSRSAGHWFRRIPERRKASEDHQTIQRRQTRNGQILQRHQHHTMSFTEALSLRSFDDSSSRGRHIYHRSNYNITYHDAIGQDMVAVLDDEALNFSRVAIMFGLHSCLKENLALKEGVAGNAFNDAATNLLQLVILGISGTVFGLQEFMATDPAPICDTLLSARANPNGRWAGRDGGTLWTRLLSYYATRIEDSEDTPGFETLRAFVRNGADLNACVEFKGTRFQPIDLIRSLLKEFPELAEELTKVLELFELSTTASPPIRIIVTGPVEQAYAPQLMSTSPAGSSSIEDAIEGRTPVDVPSSRRESHSSSSANSEASSEYGRQRVSRKARLIRKIFKT